MVFVVVCAACACADHRGDSATRHEETQTNDSVRFLAGCYTVCLLRKWYLFVDNAPLDHVVCMRGFDFTEPFPFSNPARVTSRFFFLQGRFMHMPVNTAVRAVARPPGKAAPLGVLCLRVGAFTFLFYVYPLRLCGHTDVRCYAWHGST